MKVYLAEIIFTTYEGNDVNKGTVTEQVRYRLITSCTQQTDAFDLVNNMVERNKSDVTGKYEFEDGIKANKYSIRITVPW